MRENKSYYFNICILSLHKRHLVIIVICLLFFFSCRQKEELSATSLQNTFETSENAVEINTATTEELEKLPSIGIELARKIVEHREKYGKFRRVEHLILVDGMSDKKFREIKNMVKID